MTRQLIKPDQAVVAVGNQIDAIVNECLPVAAQDSQNFVQALTLASGIKALRHIFLTDKNIQATVESMQNTHLGFMTDRTDLAIWKSKQSGNKELKPYRYEDIAEVCIEAMLKGYRITNNEFNMIAGRFYAAKNGKFRRIQECEGITDFQFTTTSPSYEKEQGGIQYAKVQGFASWKKDGQLATLGSSAEAEDKLAFKIRVNKYMGEDAIIGKALSKLFSRVLMRLEGKIMPEATDISDGDIVNAEFDATLPGTNDIDINQTIEDFALATQDIFTDPLFKSWMQVCAKTNEITIEKVKAEAMKDIDGFKNSFATWKKAQKKQPAKPADTWGIFRKKWINLKSGFEQFMWEEKNQELFKLAETEDPDLYNEGRNKYISQIGKAWPLDPTVEDMNAYRQKQQESAEAGSPDADAGVDRGQKEKDASKPSGDVYQSKEWQELSMLKEKHPDEYVEVVNIPKVAKYLDSPNNSYILKIDWIKEAIARIDAKVDKNGEIVDAEIPEGGIPEDEIPDGDEKF